MQAGLTWSKLIVKLVVVAVLVVGGVYLYTMLNAPSLPDGLQTDAKKAVFLTDGQVYFGDVEVANNDFLLIKNPYYLQTAVKLQGTGDDKEKQEAKQSLQVVALGGEGLQYHAPERAMYIPWDKIKYIENMTGESEILKVMQQDPATQQ